MQSRSGFTLVEMLLVVLILGMLTVFVIPRIAVSTDAAKANACKTNVDTINRQIELYFHNTGSWPNNLKLVTEDPNYFPDGPPQCEFGEKYKLRKEQGRYRVEEHSH
jgi:prepilin-type N-terminal cleavage/methylation domain-containing protein